MEKDQEPKKESKAALREEKRKRAKKKQATKMFTRYAVGILIVVGVIYGLVLMAKSTEPDSEDRSVSYNIQGRDHVAEGASHPPYNSNPPSSGWHYGSPTRGGFYSEPVPDEQVIHNLEHGDIWITYHPDISDAAKDELASFGGRYVIVSPREASDGDISLVAWGRVDTFDIENGVIDETRIRDFIRRYDNRGPENVRGGI